MKVKYYSVYDCIADEFGPLFPHRNDNSAYRSYELGLKDKNPDEYQLWFVGEFEDSFLGSNHCDFNNDYSHRVQTIRED